MPRAPPGINTPPGSREKRTIGLTVMLISVSAGMTFGAGGFCSLLCLMGLIVGTNLIAAGVLTAGNGPTTPIVPVLFAHARALAAFLCRKTAIVGLVIASSAVTMVSGEADDPVLCFSMFVLLLLGVSLINIGARGE